MRQRSKGWPLSFDRWCFRVLLHPQNLHYVEVMREAKETGDGKRAHPVLLCSRFCDLQGRIVPQKPQIRVLHDWGGICPVRKSAGNKRERAGSENPRESGVTAGVFSLQVARPCRKDRRGVAMITGSTLPYLGTCDPSAWAARFEIDRSSARINPVAT